MFFLVASAAVAVASGGDATAPPPLTLADLDGTPRELATLRGRIVVVNFWATWCVPCRDEMPMLARVARVYRDRGVVVVGASADTPETRHEIAPLVRDANIDFPIWVGATTVDMQRLEVGTTLPATVIVDADGTIAYRILGPLSEDDLRARLDALLGGAASTSLPARLVSHPDHHDDDETDPDHHADDDHGDAHAHVHGDDEDHQHGAVALEGASLVPS